jgi:hypothetical protein
MAVAPDSAPDDEQLERYLLGLLSDEDTERLDELSIADDEIAWRLKVIEDDLIDAYVTGALEGPRLARFESFYLSSPRRRKKVNFAGNLLRAVDRADKPGDTATRGDTPAAASSGNTLTFRPSASNVRLFSILTPNWGMAAVAALLVLVSAVLFYQQADLRRLLDGSNHDREALAGRVRDLEQQLAEERTARADAAQTGRGQTPVVAEPTGRSVAPAPAVPAPLAALVLLPQTRSTGPIATETLPSGVERVPFELRLESNDFPQYQAGLKDPATNQIVWRSAWTAPTRSGERPSLLVSVPANLLKPQHYSLELTGRTLAGRSEVVSSYTFEILPR